MIRLRSIPALFLIVLIPFTLMVWMRIHQTGGFASIELIVYPLLFGGLSVLILILIKKYFLKEKLSDFNSGPGNWYNDLGWGAVLTTIYFILFFLERLTLSDILRFNSNMELLGLMLDMRKNPILMILWFGPVLWIGIALYEELVRVFILTTLWKWSSGNLWTTTAIFISAIIFGLVHWSQGPYGIVTIGISSLVSGYFFLRSQRIMPLIYAHVLYDGLQVALLLLTYPQNN